MAFLAATSKQIPDHAILDFYNKQTYLGNQYSVSRNFSVGSSEIPLMLMQNNAQIVSPSNFISLFQNLLKVNGLTAAQSITLNVYLNPTITSAGTALTTINLRPSYGVTNSVGVLTYSPTIASNGTLVDSISAPAVSSANSSLLKIIDGVVPQALLVTGIASAASTSVNVILQWYEL